MKNTKSIIIIIVSVLLVIFFLYLVIAAVQKVWPFKEKFQVVNLTNGEVYYGHLTFFPSPRIIEPWLFQQSQPEKEGGETQLNLIPFSSLFFGPRETIFLEKEQIAWWADLEKDSQIIKFIKEKGGSGSSLQ